MLLELAQQNSFLENDFIWAKFFFFKAYLGLRTQREVVWGLLLQKGFP